MAGWALEDPTSGASLQKCSSRWRGQGGSCVRSSETTSHLTGIAPSYEGCLKGNTPITLCGFVAVGYVFALVCSRKAQQVQLSSLVRNLRGRMANFGCGWLRGRGSGGLRAGRRRMHRCRAGTLILRRQRHPYTHRSLRCRYIS